jgi:hypothetical protein
MSAARLAAVREEAATTAVRVAAAPEGAVR